MRALITGAAGFMGHHMVKHLLDHTDWEIVCLVRMSRAGDLARLHEVSRDYGEEFWEYTKDEKYPGNELFDKRVEIVRHDLNDPLDNIHKHIGEVDYIIHMAADSHVDYSIDYPVDVFLNNARSTVNLLEYTRKYQINIKKFLYFSTDEVFGSADSDAFDETSETNPSSAYSAGKAAGESITIAYNKMYEIPHIITRCMNIFGERQDPEKMIPFTIKQLLAGKKATIHGNADYIGKRSWIYAGNVADAVLEILKSGFVNEKINITSGIELDNLEIARNIVNILGIPEASDWYELIEPNKARPGYDKRYRITGRMMRLLKWEPPYDFEDSLKRTVEFSRDNRKWIE